MDDRESGISSPSLLHGAPKAVSGERADYEAFSQLLANHILDVVPPVYSVTWLVIAVWDLWLSYEGTGRIPAIAALSCGLIMMYLRRTRGRQPSQGVRAHMEIFVISAVSLAAASAHFAVPLPGAPDYLVLMVAVCPIFLAISTEGLNATLCASTAAWAVYWFLNPSPPEFVASAAALGLLWATASTQLAGRVAAWKEHLDKTARERKELQIAVEKQIEKSRNGGAAGEILNVRGEMDGLWEWNLRADSIYCSPRWRSLLGYSDETTIRSAEDWLNLIHPYDLDEFMKRLKAHLDGRLSGFECEHRIRQRDGSYRWVLSRGQVVLGEDGRPDRLPGSQVDIKRMKDYEYQLVHEATHDRLTGLPNRQVLLEELTKQVQRKKRNPSYRFALAFIDLDGFKLVNDTLGHQAGDKLLIEVARRIRSTVRPDDLVARLGGDEFVVVMPGIGNPEQAARIAARIQKGVSEGVLLDARNVSVAASIGIALATSNQLGVNLLMRNADLAMYHAKRKGKARTEFFSDELSEKASQTFEVQNELKAALDNGELELFYQPIISLPDCRISAVEALVRWRRRDGVLLPPADFIPVAEESDLIVDLGVWVLKTACKDLTLWNRDRDEALTVSVNLSARQLTGSEFDRQVKSTLLAYDLDPRYLQLEITENVLVDDWEGAFGSLEILSLLGVRLAIDDFGTGYSSLSYLRTLPCNVLKIDRSFIKDIATDPKVQAIAGSIFQMADGLGLNVVAEGVETISQLNCLRSLGCRQIQGFLASRPMDSTALQDLLQSDQAIRDVLQMTHYQTALSFA